MRKKIIVGVILGFVLLSQASTALPWGGDTILKKIKEKKQISIEEFKQKRKEIKDLILQKQLEWRNQIKSKREKIKAKIEAFKEELKKRMKEKIKKAKQKIVERIYERINALNERMTDHYLNILERLETILEKIESRTAKAKLNGKETSEVESIINKAYLSIEKAREAVRQQAEKVYQPPEITSKENLKTDVGKLRKNLHTDLKAVEKLVKKTRDLVQEAAITLAQIPKVNEYEVPISKEEMPTSILPTTQPIE